MNLLVKAIGLIHFGITSLADAAPKTPVPSHCQKGEEIYFSCKTGKSKTISLCGTTADGKILSIKYSFGDLKKPELVYSAFAKDNFGSFKFSHYFRYGVDYFRVNFVRNNYRYEIYKDYDDQGNPKESSGIIVENLSAAAKEVNIACRQDIITNLLPLSSTLPCDEESALGCAK